MFFFYQKCGCGWEVRPLQIGCAHTCACAPKSGRAMCVRATQKKVATHALGLGLFIDITIKKVSKKIHQKWLRKFTKKEDFSWKSFHENSPKVSAIIHLFCSQKITFYVHEMFATQMTSAEFHKKFCSIVTFLWISCLEAITEFWAWSSANASSIHQDNETLKRGSWKTILRDFSTAQLTFFSCLPSWGHSIITWTRRGR